MPDDLRGPSNVGDCEFNKQKNFFKEMQQKFANISSNGNKNGLRLRGNSPVNKFQVDKQSLH